MGPLDDEREHRVFVQEAIDYGITGNRSWADLSGSEQDEYLLGCFMGEEARLALEKRLDLLDRTASSIADGLLGPFRQLDIRTGEAHYRPESPDRAQRILTIRMAVLRSSALGDRLSRARTRRSSSRTASTDDYARDPRLHFYSVGPPDMLGLHILDDQDYGGLPAVNPYDGPWNDWAALEAQQAKELRALKDTWWAREMAAPTPIEPATLPPKDVEGIDARAVNRQRDTTPTNQERRPLHGAAADRPTRVQKLLWRVRPPEECRIALQSAASILEGTVSKSVPVYALCRAVLRNSELVLQRVRREGYAADELGLIVARNTLAQHLCSGQYHVYRGVLSMAGQQLMLALGKACSELERRGYATPAESKESLQNIRNDISRVG